MDILGQSSLLVGVTSFSLGFSVLSRNVKNVLFLSFAILTTLISAWSLAFFLDKIWGEFGFYRLHLLLNIWLAPAGLFFIRVMVRMQDKASYRLLYFSILWAFSLSMALLLGQDLSNWIFPLVYFTPALIVVQTLQLMWIDLQLKRGFEKLPKLPTVGLARKNLIYVGALIVLGTSIMDHVPWMGVVLPSFGNIGLIVYLFFLSQAITQQRLLNMNALFSRFLVLLVVALTLTSVYSLLVAWIENSPGLFFLNSFIASFLILMLLEPLRSFVGYFTHRLLTQKHRRLELVLREAQRKLTGIVDLGTLFQAVLLTSEQTLQPQWAALFVLKSDGTRFRRIRTTGREPDFDSALSTGSAFRFREVMANSPILQHCEGLARRGKFPVLLDQLLENEMDRSASRVQREHLAMLIQGLKALKANLLIPLFDSGKILGFISLWVSHPPEGWGNNWGLLPIIYPYFEQAARTMQSMEVYARQREKERMAAGLAHEIRNPLGAIKGAAQYLDPSSDRPESRFLKVILEEVDRLNRVVSQFLDYSKPPSTEFKLVDLNQLTAKTTELMKPSIPSTIVFEFIPARVSAYVLASAEQLQQVLINLIQNAQNALGQKASGKIRVSVEVEGEPPTSEVYLIVEDSGQGIKKENLDKLFIPFFTTSPRGTGLGLSISQKIIEAHRGRIEIISEEGRFARFSVILPFNKVD